MPFTGRKAYRSVLCVRYGERPERQPMSRSNQKLGSGGIATEPGIADNYWEGLKVAADLKGWEKHIND